MTLRFSGGSANFVVGAPGLFWRTILPFPEGDPLSEGDGKNLAP